MDDAFIAFDGVSLSFGVHAVLRNVRLAIPRNQTIVVIGESGCGKTVLLKLIIGLLTPTTGKVRFDGKILAELDDAALTRERLRFGFLFQGAALFDSLNVFDNVAFGLRTRGTVKGDDIKAQVRQRLEEVGLAAAIESKKPVELSGGMKKRVGLARALAMNPEVMLYDEPTTGLDPIMSDVIAELIVLTRQRRPVTSVVVTHDMKTALKVADRVVMLASLTRVGPDENQLIFDGTPQELTSTSDPRVRQFIEGQAGDRLREIAG